MEEKKLVNRLSDKIPEYALCMICFKPKCDLRCKGPCMRTFHSCCLKEKVKRTRGWKCSLCAKKEIDKHSKVLKFAKEECNNRHEYPGSGFSQPILLDISVHHKKREVLTPKNVKCAGCSEKHRTQLIRCIHCGTLYHRGCLPLNSIILSHRFIICPSHYQSWNSFQYFDCVDSSTDYMHKARQEQFDKLKGITATTGRGAHFMRGRGRGRGRGAGGNRGGRGGKRLLHIIESDPTLGSTKEEVIQCQRCGRIRHYPAYIARDQLPKEWYCEYSVWDKGLCSCEDGDEKEEEREREKDGMKKITEVNPAIWGGESIKTTNKFHPASLNSVGIINYVYFSKFAQRATARINYLGTVSSSYAFNHNLNRSDPIVQSLAENTPLNKLAQAVYIHYRGYPHCSIKAILSNESLFKSVFDGQKNLVIQCVRYMKEKNLIVLIGEERGLTEETEWIFNGRPEDAHMTVKELRLQRQFGTK